ncbi:MAG: glycerophosphodiester phosphodiesterase family protein [Pseudorhodoplanes sp.]
MGRLDWLTARPIAHRGLHDPASGVVENTPSAFSAAIAGGYGIECDIQVSADGEAVVHHDAQLGRLTEGAAALATLSADRLRQVAFKATADHMLTLPELCALTRGRVPLVIEIKSAFDGDLRLTERAVSVLRDYQGPAALMSFDPAIVAHLRRIAPDLPRGIVAERHYDDPEWAPLPARRRRSMAHLLHAFRTRPHFVAYHVKDLPAPGPFIARAVFGRPLLTWTVRSAEDRARAARWADQMIFEGFRP